MNLPTLESLGDLKGKRVFVRVDWNVPMQDSKVVDDFRIKQSLPTLNWLAGEGAKVILATHLEDDSASVEPLRSYVPEGMELLENLRQNPGEKSNDENFARELASKADFYVNEAFSASHRAHASLVGVPKLLPHAAGRELVSEVWHLSQAFNPEHPFLFILGGAKFETKLPLLDKFVKTADALVVCGALAHNFYRVEGIDIKNSLVSPGNFDTEALLATGKIMLPPDPKWHGDRIVDAGPETLKELETKVKEAQFVLWNGPLGAYELGFTESTLQLARMLAESGAKTVVGGGDTLAAIEELNIFDKFNFVSAAGGAMLDFLANETLPALEALTH
jgi:phosphoglycerate kinase